MTRPKPPLDRPTCRRGKKERPLEQYGEWALFGLLAAFLFFSPIPHTTSIKEFAYYLSLPLGLWLWVRKRFPAPSLRHDAFLGPLLLFLAWACLGIPFALDRAGTLHDLYSHLLRYILLYMLLRAVISSRSRLETLAWVVVLAATAFAGGAMVHDYLLLGRPLSRRLAAEWAQCSPNLIGVSTLPPLFICLNRLRETAPGKGRLVSLACAAVLLSATLLTQSRGTLMALAAGGILFFPRTKRSLLLTSAGVPVLLGLVVLLSPLRSRFTAVEDPYETVSRNIRITIHLVTLEVIRDHPLLGIGFGNRTYGTHLDWEDYNQRIPAAYRLTPALREQYRDVINTPHNMFMNIAVRTGLVGLALFVMVLWRFGAEALRSILRERDPWRRNWGQTLGAGFLAFLVIGLFEPVFNHMQESMLLVLFAFLGTVASKAVEVNPE